MRRFGIVTTLALAGLLTLAVIPASAQNTAGATAPTVSAPIPDSGSSTTQLSSISKINLSLTPSAAPTPSLGAAASNGDSFPRFQVFGGYSFLSNDIALVDDGEFQQFDHGYAASVSFSLNRNFGILADFSGHNGAITVRGTHQTEDQYYFLFGPEVSHAFGKARISGHVTVGVAQQHYGENFSGESHFNVKEADFAAGAGGSFDWMFTDRWGWRVLQIDYLMSLFDGGKLNNFRGSTGIIFRFK